MKVMPHNDRKENIVCPIKGCTYSSRKFITNKEYGQEYNESRLCPIHRTQLVNVGNKKLARKEKRR